jgi:hypothetical protein
MAEKKRAAKKGLGRGAGPASRRARSDSVHIIKVTLQHVRPPIWRRIAVPSHFTLGQLHDVLQVAMGWTNSHLHQFRIGTRLYSDPAFEPGGFGLEVGSEDSITVTEALPQKGSRASYEYDFGDGWEHQLQVEKVEPAEPGVDAPLCLKGARACPPEDCGGPFGYAELLEAIGDPQHERHEELLEWLGGGFDAEAFDLAAVNRELQQFR